MEAFVSAFKQVMDVATEREELLCAATAPMAVSQTPRLLLLRRQSALTANTQLLNRQQNLENSDYPKKYRQSNYASRKTFDPIGQLNKDASEFLYRLN